MLAATTLSLAGCESSRSGATLSAEQVSCRYSRTEADPFEGMVDVPPAIWLSVVTTNSGTLSRSRAASWDGRSTVPRRKLGCPSAGIPVPIQSSAERNLSSGTTIMRTSVLIAFAISFFSGQGPARGQDSSAAEPGPKESKSPIHATDPRVVALREAYREQVAELTAQLHQDIESLGTIKPPPHLEFVGKRKGGSSFHFSTAGFGNHTTKINPDDIEATQAWRHYLESPPMTPREALAVADSTLRKWSEDSEDVRFQLKKLSLVPLSPTKGKWYWEAEYEVSKQSHEKNISIAIRMDGRVLTRLSAIPSKKPPRKKLVEIEESVPNFANANGLWKITSSESHFTYGESWTANNPPWRYVLFVDGLVVTFLKRDRPYYYTRARRVSSHCQDGNTWRFTTRNCYGDVGDGELSIDGGVMTFRDQWTTLSAGRREVKFKSAMKLSRIESDEAATVLEYILQECRFSTVDRQVESDIERFRTDQGEPNRP